MRRSAPPIPPAPALALALALIPAATARAGLLSFQSPASPAPASDPAPADPRSEPDLRLEIELTAWFMGPSGDLQLPVDSGSGPGPFTTQADAISVNDLNLDKTRLRPRGAFRLSFGDWLVGFSGADYSSDRQTTADIAGRLGSVAFSAGDRLESSFSYGMYDLYAGYRVWSHDFAEASQQPGDADTTRLDLYLVGGVRLHDVDIRIQRGPAQAEIAQLFAEPFAGARAQATLADHFGVHLMLTAGGLPIDDRSSVSLDVEVAFEFRPLPNLALQLGYRQLAFILEDGEDLGKFEYDGRLAGLFTGITLRF
jgi:hypothetical protein